jgi:hypothetical protein
MKILVKWIFIIFIGAGIIYINEILKQPGNTFAEKYNNLVKQSNILVEKAKKGEL